MLDILVVDDHPMFREAIVSVIAEVDSDRCVREACTLEEALAVLAATPNLDLILLDLFLPGSKGLDGLAALRNAAPTVPIVVVSAWSERGPVLQAIERGAVGYIPKTSPRRVFVQALRHVLAGAIYVPPDVVRASGGSPPPPDSGFASDSLASLTRMQIAVLRHLAHGASNKEIARILGLAEPTVKGHVSAVLHKLNLRGRWQVMAMARPAIDHLDMLNPSNLACGAPDRLGSRGVKDR